MNIDPAMAAGYAIVAVGGFALGALTGRWMLTEMRTALGAVQTRLSELEQKVIGTVAAPASSAAPASNNSAAPVHPSAAAAQAAALEHHAAAVEKLAAAVDKHAQAVDDHGAATVAAAVEMGSHPAPAAPTTTAATFATPLHATGVAMGASVAPVAAAAVAAAPQG
jgi:methyl-accepting chemotaxis protein